MAVNVALIGLAFVRLILGIVFAVAALYIASSVLGRLTKGIDDWAEIGRGNIAVAIFMGGIFISVATIIAPGISGLFTRWDALAITIGFIQLIIALALAMAMQYVALSVFGKLTKELDEWSELKKGNVAVGITMAAIVIAVAAVVVKGVETLIAAVFA
ncbi:MAG: DUF350 domain-containing protein [Candidatus Bathyarchaeia archaeon]|nr:DUF350 domain-containing protein [Candidatus Bathyarchaeota archaeon]